MDAFGGAWIDDIKFVKSFEVGKYQGFSTNQNVFRLETELMGMRYLYSDGSAVYIDEYRRECSVSIPTVRSFGDGW